VVQGLRVAARALRRAGYQVEEVAPPRFLEAAELWSPVVVSEARFGLIPAVRQFGDRKVNEELDSWLELTPALDLQGYSRAMGLREQILRAWRVFMETYPIIVTPVSWRTQFVVDQQGPQVFAEMLKAVSPMLSVAFLGLPTGVQVVADRFREDLCFDAGEAVEAAVNMGTPIDPARPSPSIRGL
jgi:amidase